MGAAPPGGGTPALRTCQHGRVHRVTVGLALLLALWPAPLPAARDLDVALAEWAGPRSLAEALADRFGPVEREPGFDQLRPKLARSGLVPSLMFDDATAWTTGRDNWRAFDLVGYPSGGVYHIGMRAEAPRPAVKGQYRGRVRLERLAPGRFEWTVNDELAIGQARPSDLGGGLDAILRVAERSTEDLARAAIAKTLPRASAQFGQLLRLETLTLQPDAHGATFVRLAVRLIPAGISGFAPRYAAFLEKHARPARVALVVADPEGVTWWTLEAADGLWTIRLRIREGSLVPLEGRADRRLPGRLRATADVATRIGRFEVGARRIAADLALTRTPGEKGFSARFSEEPDWRLPFLVETFLDRPLHYPFATPGSEVEWAAREAEAGNLLVRRYRVRVRETWILRWLGGKVDGAVGDFRNGAELEADRYHRACLLALADDLAALDASR
jgi:hypothetical protein